MKALKIVALLANFLYNKLRTFTCSSLTYPTLCDGKSNRPADLCSQRRSVPSQKRARQRAASSAKTRSPSSGPDGILQRCCPTLDVARLIYQSGSSRGAVGLVCLQDKMRHHRMLQERISLPQEEDLPVKRVFPLHVAVLIKSSVLLAYWDVCLF